MFIPCASCLCLYPRCISHCHSKFLRGCLYKCLRFSSAVLNACSTRRCFQLNDCAYFSNSAICNYHGKRSE